jgi:hypothetical protein
MGVAIHYRGALDDPAQLDNALTMLKAECDRRKWPYRELDFEASGPFEYETTHTVPGPLPGWEDIIAETHIIEMDTRWRGVIIEPHEECEGLVLMFEPKEARLMMLMSIGETQSLSYYLSVKTQFAPVEIHVEICDVLHRLKNEFGSTQLIVQDESEYFDRQDLEALLKMRGTIERAMQNTELITRLAMLATIDQEVEPPSEDDLKKRFN